jgi:hypothetical protein
LDFITLYELASRLEKHVILVAAASPKEHEAEHNHRRDERTNCCSSGDRQGLLHPQRTL